MNTWADEIELLQTPYRGTLSPTERLAALEQALADFQSITGGYQSVVDAIRSCMAELHHAIEREASGHCS